MSQSFVSTWKNQVIVEVIESLKVKYQGSQGYLSSEQKQEVIDWIKSQERGQIEDLQIHIYSSFIWDVSKSAKRCEERSNLAFWEWGMGNWEWKEGSEHFLLVINNPFLFTSDLEML